MQTNPLTNQGNEAVNKGDYEKAMKLYRQAALQNDYLAMYNLACMYYFGDGVDKDDAQAFEWFTKASNLGDCEAACRAGGFLEHGIGTAKDAVKAFDYYEISAKGGSLAGMANLGRCYLEAIGTKQDCAKGLEWLEKASSLGNGIASEMLGDYARKGQYGPVNLSRAYQYYERGMKQKYAPAVRKLARMLEKGEGCTPDKQKAGQLVLLADQMEHSDQQE